MALESLWPDDTMLPVISDQPQTVRALLLMMAAKHRPTYLHLCQVSTYSEMLAQWLQLAPCEVEEIAMAALLHDIGKVAVPDEVLTKPGRLTDQEMQVMTLHAEWGSEILYRTGGFHALYEAVRHHHEWFDGRGYPTGLAGQSIPFVSRLIGVTDAYDTMTAPRPYRKSISVEHALQELERCSGTQFDPEIVQSFTAMVREAGRTGVAWAQRRSLRSGAQQELVEPLAVRLTRTGLKPGL